MKVCSYVLCTTPSSPQLVSSSVRFVFLSNGSTAWVARICSVHRSWLLPPSSSSLSTPALSEWRACISQGCSGFLLSTLALFVSETSWVQQLNSEILSQESQPRKVPIVTTLALLLSLQRASAVSPELVSPVERREQTPPKLQSQGCLSRLAFLV